jgi:hypothetical protein
VNTTFEPDASPAGNGISKGGAAASPGSPVVVIY